MIYSLILRNKETVADFSEMEGDFHDYSMKVLKNINRNDEFTISKILFSMFIDFFSKTRQFKLQHHSV